MNDRDAFDELWAVLREYEERLLSQLDSRWQRLPLDLSRREASEVSASLLARQTALGIQMARSPYIWNGHVAPLVLRAMVDLLISLKWILEDPLERSRKFVLYGIGQMKLQIEHRTVQLSEDGHDPDEDELLKSSKAWIDSQRFPFLTEVDVGTWSGLSVREMAIEADCKGLLDYAYAPFSAAVHNMWHHVSRYNLIPCRSELHRHHNLPWVDLGVPDLDYFYTSAKYVERAFEFAESAHGIPHPDVTALDWLGGEIDRLGNVGSDEPDETKYPHDETTTGGAG